MSAKVKNYLFGIIGAGVLLVAIGLFFSYMNKDKASHDTHGTDHNGHSSVTAPAQADVLKVADPQQEGHDQEGEHAHDGHDSEGSHGAHHEVHWYSNFLASLLHSNIFFLRLALGALFFLCIHQITNAGWQTAIKRIPESISQWILYGGIILLAIGILFGKELYDWLALSEGADALIDKKRAYLNFGFWIVRAVLFIGVWYLVAYVMRKFSVREDTEGDTNYRFFHRSNPVSAAFIVFFALSFTLFSIDWVKSLEPHWFSTIFGVYMFAGAMASSTAFMGLVLLFLKRQGYMSYANESHFHDMYKYAFGFSVFWGYIFVSQFLLIWYSNMPEETFYFVKRQALRVGMTGVNGDMYLGKVSIFGLFGIEYATLFWVKVVLCFAVPFLGLMQRNSKRVPASFIWVAIVMLIGHWVDLWDLIMPGAVQRQLHIGFTEVGMTLIFLGAFGWATLRTLGSANLVPLRHPYLDESLHHSTGPV